MITVKDINIVYQREFYHCKVSAYVDKKATINVSDNLHLLKEGAELFQIRQDILKKVTKQLLDGIYAEIIKAARDIAEAGIISNHAIEDSFIAKEKHAKLDKAINVFNELVANAYATEVWLLRDHAYL